MDSGVGFEDSNPTTDPTISAFALIMRADSGGPELSRTGTVVEYNRPVCDWPVLESWCNELLPVPLTVFYEVFQVMGPLHVNYCAYLS
jgi:hypothetical protein